MLTVMERSGYERAAERDRGSAVVGIFEADPPSEQRIRGGSDPDCCCSSSMSSIGRNSDGGEGGKSSDGGDCGENEAESSYKSPLDMMDSLEEVLPIRRGISKFYKGKSKSFMSLAEASSASSAKDITKPENAYTRRRKNLVTHSLWDKNKSRGGISKRSISSSKSTLALAMAAISSSSSSSSEDSSLCLSPTNLSLPPLHPQTKGYFDNLASSQPLGRGGFCAWRSYSAADLPRFLPAVASMNNGDS